MWTNRNIAITALRHLTSNKIKPLRIYSALMWVKRSQQIRVWSRAVRWRDRLGAMVAAHEQKTGEQVVIVTLASLQGLPIEDFGYRLGRAWGIGEKGKNTGALLIIAPKERAVRIEVGYRLEGPLTDAISRAIIERDIVPSFRQGNFDRGVLAGTAIRLSPVQTPSLYSGVRARRFCAGCFRYASKHFGLTAIRPMKRR